MRVYVHICVRARCFRFESIIEYVELGCVTTHSKCRAGEKEQLFLKNLLFSCIEVKRHRLDSNLARPGKPIQENIGAAKQARLYAKFYSVHFD